MERFQQWPVQYPRRMVLLELLAILAAACCLVYSFPLMYVVPAALLPLIRSGRRIRGKLMAAHTRIGVSSAGCWHIDEPGNRRALSLVHAWPAFAWVTLRFRSVDGSDPRQALCEVTVWKCMLHAEAWRRLNVVVASQLADGSPLPAGTSS